MGASVHYAGTVPMTREGSGASEPGGESATETGRARRFANVWLADEVPASQSALPVGDGMTLARRIE